MLLRYPVHQLATSPSASVMKLTMVHTALPTRLLCMLIPIHLLMPLITLNLPLAINGKLLVCRKSHGLSICSHVCCHGNMHPHCIDCPDPAVCFSCKHVVHSGRLRAKYAPQCMCTCLFPASLVQSKTVTDLCGCMQQPHIVTRLHVGVSESLADQTFRRPNMQCLRKLLHKLTPLHVVHAHTHLWYDVLLMPTSITSGKLEVSCIVGSKAAYDVHSNNAYEMLVWCRASAQLIWLLFDQWLCPPNLLVWLCYEKTPALQFHTNVAISVFVGLVTMVILRS